MSTNTLAADVVIAGGGAAGLSAAVTLARSLRSVIVVDSGHPRNAPATGAHNLLGREGIAPDALLRLGRDEAQSYGARVISGEITTVDRVGSASGGGAAFEAGLSDGTRIRARRILLASGLIDELPDVPGLAPLWGTDVLHCPFCHGYEVRGTRIAVLGTSPMAMHQVMLFCQLSSQVTLIAHQMGELTDEQRAQAAVLNVTVVESPASRITADERGIRTVVLADGRELELDALVVAPRFAARGELYESLGGTLEATPMGTFIPTEMGGRTPVDGVWAAGNSADIMAMVGASAAAGVQAGAAIHGDLALTDMTAALASAALDPLHG